MIRFVNFVFLFDKLSGGAVNYLGLGASLYNGSNAAYFAA
jgi:hypothetical protein